MINSNTVSQHATVTLELREHQKNQAGFPPGSTGLPSSGVSKLAVAAEEKLYQKQIPRAVMDGNKFQLGPSADLGFLDKERQENSRRIVAAGKLFVGSRSIIVTACISPYRNDREQVYAVPPRGDILGIYCECPTDVSDQHDVNGLYQRAGESEMKHITGIGIDTPHEISENPDLIT